MKVLVVTVVLLMFIHGIVCPPVGGKAKEKEVKEEEDDTEDPSANVEYSRYLREVVEALEEDQDFVKKLEEANITDIKSGDIARHIELVNHNVRNKLDEIKRREIERLNEMKKALERKEHGGPEGLDPQMTKLVAHLHHDNPGTFEEEDLRKLIQQATKDLEQVDDKRRKDFKNYEMEKEHLKREKLKHMDEAHRKAEEERLRQMEEKHRDHPKLHHPGSKAQLEEVWEHEDGMDKGDFNPKTFFALHDKDGNKYLDESEIEALFQSELDKMYDANATEDDMIEREEEMNRMREHLFNEVDKNKDRLISYDEFMDSTKNKDFDKDEGWKGLDEEKPYTDEEFAQFEKDYESDVHPGGNEGTPEPHHEEELKFKPKVPPVPVPVQHGDNQKMQNLEHPGQVVHENQAEHKQQPEHKQPPPPDHVQPPAHHETQPPPHPAKAQPPHH